MSVLIVGHPKLLPASCSLLTTFLHPTLVDLPKSRSGSNSFTVGSPWMHLAAFHISDPTTFLTPYAWFSGTGGFPYPKFLAIPSWSYETAFWSSTVFFTITVFGNCPSNLSACNDIAAPFRSLYSPYPNLWSLGSTCQLYSLSFYWPGAKFPWVLLYILAMSWRSSIAPPTG